jgi:hypothetical protein
MDLWLATMPESERAAIMNAALNPEWDHTELLKKLREYGAPQLGDKAFGTWRRSKGLRK